jgi:hypothetical protein
MRFSYSSVIFGIIIKEKENYDDSDDHDNDDNDDDEDDKDRELEGDRGRRR